MVQLSVDGSPPDRAQMLGGAPQKVSCPRASVISTIETSSQEDPLFLALSL